MTPVLTAGHGTGHGTGHGSSLPWDDSTEMPKHDLVSERIQVRSQTALWKEEARRLQEVCDDVTSKCSSLEKLCRFKDDTIAMCNEKIHELEGDLQACIDVAGAGNPNRLLPSPPPATPLDF